MMQATEIFFGRQRAAKRDCEELRDRTRAQTPKVGTVDLSTSFIKVAINMFDTLTYFCVCAHCACEV